MTNILSFYREDGKEVQINQAELNTKEGREWLKKALTNNQDEKNPKGSEDNNEGQSNPDSSEDME